jgi:hypothetical protein
MATFSSRAWLTMAMERLSSAAWRVFVCTEDEAKYWFTPSTAMAITAAIDNSSILFLMVHLIFMKLASGSIFRIVNNRQILPDC